MSRECVLYDRNGWRLTSYGNGAAYLLEDTAQNKSVFFQYGDDAVAFRANTMEPEGGWLLGDCELRFADYSEVMT